jgi:hypothetical protein
VDTETQSERQTIRQLEEHNMKSKFVIPDSSYQPAGYSVTQTCDHAAAGHMCCWGVSGVPFLTHNPFPTATPSISPPPHDLIHFVTTETSLTMPGAEGTTESFVLHKAFAMQKNILNNSIVFVPKI